mgnify:CR=1 FL=1
MPRLHDPLYIDCDLADCLALRHPVSDEEYRTANNHFRNHTLWGACVHSPLWGTCPRCPSRPVARQVTIDEQAILRPPDQPVEAKIHVLEQSLLDLIARVANVEQHLEQHLDDPHPPLEE